MRRREFLAALGDGGRVGWRMARVLRGLHRRAAVFVDKILKGEKPSEIPVEQPTRFNLIVNMKAARMFGFTIPPALLVRADEVIE